MKLQSPISFSYWTLNYIFPKVNTNFSQILVKRNLGNANKTFLLE